jgi:hypothetical protein
MGMSTWVPAVLECGWNILRTETRTSSENCCNWAQQTKSRRAHETRPKDNSQRNCSAVWSGAPCGQGDDVAFAISESLFPLGSPFAYGYRGIQNGWELLCHSNCSPALAPPPQTTTCSGPWKVTRVVTTMGLTRQSRKPCEAGCEELERTSTAEASLRFCIACRNA